MRLKTYTYTANISKNTHERLDNFLEHLTDLYNAALEERQSAYKKGISLSLYDQQKSLTEYRKDDNQYFCIAQQSILRRVDNSFKRFFKKISGYPKYKSKRNGIKSFVVPGRALRNLNHFIYIKGVGSFKFKKSLPAGKIKQAIIKKTPKRIKVFFLMEIESKEQRSSDIPIGIDMGILNRVTLSNGFQVEKRILNRDRIKELQRQLSRTKKESNNRKKIITALKKEWQKTTDKEYGYLHELTSDLVKNVSNCFVVEDLRIQNMMKNKRLARSITEQQWGKFIQMLTYKCEWTGGWVKKIDPKNTSKICNKCGHINNNLSLNDRTFICNKCDYEEDRDINAAKNIVGWQPLINGPTSSDEKTGGSSVNMINHHSAKNFEVR